MDITYQKRYDTTLVFCLAEDTHTGNLFQPLHGILGQFVFIGGNLVHPNQRNVVQSFGKSGSTDIIRRTGFKLEGQFIEGSLFKRYMLNHLSTALIGRYPIQPPLFTIKHPYPRRTIHLVRGENEEIGIQILHIYRHVGNGLGTVHKHRNTLLMGKSNHLLDGIDRTQHIGNMRHTDNPGTFGEQLPIFVQ